MGRAPPTKGGARHAWRSVIVVATAATTAAACTGIATEAGSTSTARATAPAAAAEATAAEAAATTTATGSTAEPAAATASAGSALLCLIHTQGTTVDHRAIELRDRTACIAVRSHRYERKPSRTAGLAIENQMNVRDLSHRRKRGSHCISCRME